MNNLRRIRKQRQLPLAALAVRSKSGVNTLICVERYGHDPRLETKQKIAAALDVSITEIWPEGASTTPQTAA